MGEGSRPPGPAGLLAFTGLNYTQRELGGLGLTVSLPDRLSALTPPWHPPIESILTAMSRT